MNGYAKALVQCMVSLGIITTNVVLAEDSWTILDQAGPSIRSDIQRTNQTYYPFPDIDSRSEWITKRIEWQNQIRFSMGCYPEPPKTDLAVERNGILEADGVIAETIRFQSLPGVYVTGNLHRPSKQGTYPAVLSVHGHWGPGRFENSDNNRILGRAHHLARMGYVVLTLDMIGYADFVQFPHHWGEPIHWMWGLNAHGLQYWNTVRALDVLVAMDSVDPKRIGMTGASGGGTQTFSLMATDERIRAAAPVNMISSHFQGGCICENAPGLRVHGFNTPFGAMMAPKPLLLVSASGDWTNETLIEEYPAIRSIYDLFDAENHVHGVQVDAPHNYNRESREHVYSFFADSLGGSLIENEIILPDDLSTYRVHPNGAEDLPDDARNLDDLFADWKDMSEEQLQLMRPASTVQLEMAQSRGKQALTLSLQAQIPEKDDLIIERVVREETEYGFRDGLVLGRKGIGERIPVWVLLPDQSGDIRGTVLLLHDEGIEAWLEGDQPNSLVSTLLEQGTIVVLADLFQQGSQIVPDYDDRVSQIAHFYCYNKSITALQVQDILTVTSYVDSRYDTGEISIAGKGDTGLTSLLACAISDTIDQAVLDTQAVDISSDEAVLDTWFVPGIRRAGDFRVAQALLAPRPLILTNTAMEFDTEWAFEAYATLGSSDHLEIVEQAIDDESLAQWLTRYRSVKP